MTPSTPSRALGNGDSPSGNGASSASSAPPSQFPPLSSFAGNVEQQLAQATKWRHEHSGLSSSPNDSLSSPSERVDELPQSKNATRKTSGYGRPKQSLASQSSAPAHHRTYQPWSHHPQRDSRQWDNHPYGQTYNYTQLHQSNDRGYRQPHPTQRDAYHYHQPHAAHPNLYASPQQYTAPSNSYDFRQPFPAQSNTQGYHQGLPAQSNPYGYPQQYAVPPSAPPNVPPNFQGNHHPYVSQPNKSYCSDSPSVPDTSPQPNTHTTVYGPRPLPGPVIARTPTPARLATKTHALVPKAAPINAAGSVADRDEPAASHPESVQPTTPQLWLHSSVESSSNRIPAPVRRAVAQSAPCSPLTRFSIDTAAGDLVKPIIGNSAPHTPGEPSLADTPVSDDQPTIGLSAPHTSGEPSSAVSPAGDAVQPTITGKKRRSSRRKPAKKVKEALDAPPPPQADSLALGGLSIARTGDRFQSSPIVEDTVTPTDAQSIPGPPNEPSSSTSRIIDNKEAKSIEDAIKPNKRNNKSKNPSTIEVPGDLEPRTHPLTSQIARVGPWAKDLAQALAIETPLDNWESGRLPKKARHPTPNANISEQEKGKMTQDKGKRKASEDPDSPIAAKRIKHDDSAVPEPRPKMAIIPFPEKPAVQEERNGEIEFHVVNNDGQSNSHIILTHLKCIFQKQLPKMPKDYIARLVYDRTHLSIAIVKYPLEVVGGITFRPFRDRKFAEIVFCAISSDQQVKGYGAHLMAHLKDYVKATSPVMHFLTYADNYAIGYFKKQGFTKEITLDKSVWMGYIKDYEGGTIMQCTMLPRVRYLETGRMLLKQRELVKAKTRAVSKSHVVHQPPKQWKNGIKPIDPMTIDAIRNSGWSPEMDELARQPRRGANYNQLLHLLNALQNHQAAWPFLVPVNRDEVQDYYEVIKEPMDLSTMEQKLDADKYLNPEDFLKDAMLIFKNCRQYNSEGTPYTKMANKLEKFLWTKVREIPEWSHYEDDLAAKK